MTTIEPPPPPATEAASRRADQRRRRPPRQRRASTSVTSPNSSDRSSPTACSNRCSSCPPTTRASTWSWPVTADSPPPPAPASSACRSSCATSTGPPSSKRCSSRTGTASDLNVREEVDAIATLISIDTGVTPAKLSKRIGKSQRWVRDRMAITVLPARWLDKLSDGDLTLAQAVAAAGCADLGPDHVEARVRRTGRQRPVGPRPGPHRRALPATRSSSTPTRPQRSPSCEKGQVAYFTANNPPPNTARSLVALGTRRAGRTAASRATPCTSDATRGRTGSA